MGTRLRIQVSHRFHKAHLKHKVYHPHLVPILVRQPYTICDSLLCTMTMISSLNILFIDIFTRDVHFACTACAKNLQKFLFMDNSSNNRNRCKLELPIYKFCNEELAIVSPNGLKCLF